MSSSEEDGRVLPTERKQSITSTESEEKNDLDEVEYTNCRMEQLPCFHDATTRTKAEILLENAPEGCYLVRTSTDAANYSISVRTDEDVKHFQINFADGRYSFGRTIFWSPFLIWEHLQQRPVLECDEGVKVHLLYPFLNESKTSRVPQTESRYSTVFRHYTPDVDQPETPPRTPTKKRTSIDRNSTLASTIINSLEGRMYKRKDGKTWQRRWCILRANCLMYKKNERAGKTRNELNLSEALDIEDDYPEKDRKNCFRIIFPKVAYIFSAESPWDRKLWFENIQRRINEYSGPNPNRSFTV